MLDLVSDSIELLEERLGVNIPSFVFWIILIGIFIAIIRYAWVCEIHPMIVMIHEINAKLEKTDKIDELEKKQRDLEKESRESDKVLDNKIASMSEKLDILNEKFDKKTDRDDEVRRGELKDRIRQSYGYYHNRGYITGMELEALKGLINSYEKSGGANSFVHTVVEPEMWTWEVREA